MVVKLYESDGVKVFNVTADKVLPQWVQKKRGRKLSRDEGYARHIELLQDFGCPSACHRIKIAPDEQHIFACGVHAPRVRVYDLHNLSLKFERHFDSEIINFQILSEDYSKAVFLCMDRSLNFHARGGQHFATRVPKFGRTLAYLPQSAEIVVGGSAAELWRVNLHEGRFMAPVPVAARAVNALGCEDGALECFDPRSRSSLGVLSAASALGTGSDSITALRFDGSGLYIAAGTSGGKVGVFDLRKPEPLVVKDHQYDAPIVDIKFHCAAGDHTARQRVISSDTHIVKIWDKDTGEAYTAIEPPGGGINDTCVWPGSGLIMLATDAPKAPAFFVPSLGPAPPWCSFLEAVVEDLEAAGGGDAGAVVYDDYRFVTKAELEKLELEHLVGTPMLRAYMHGFFVDARLYRKAQARLEPFAYDVYREKRVAERMEQERQSRIATVRKLPKVNAATHLRLQAAAMETSTRKADVASSAAAGRLLEDERFAALFDDADFAVDENSRTFKELNPNAGTRKKTEQEQLIEEHFQSLPDADDSDDGDGAVSSDGGSSDGEDHGLPSVVGAGPAGVPAAGANPEGARRRTQMLEGREDASADLFARGASVAAVREKPLGVRAEEDDDGGAVQPRRGRAPGSGSEAWGGGFSRSPGADAPRGGRSGRGGRGRGSGGRGWGRSGAGRGGRGRGGRGRGRGR